MDTPTFPPLKFKNFQIDGRTDGWTRANLNVLPPLVGVSSTTVSDNPCGEVDNNYLLGNLYYNWYIKQ